MPPYPSAPSTPPQHLAPGPPERPEGHACGANYAWRKGHLPNRRPGRGTDAEQLLSSRHRKDTKKARRRHGESTERARRGHGVETERGARLQEPRPVLPGPSPWPGAARSVRSRPSFQLGTGWLPVPSRCLLVARPPCPHLSGRFAPPRRPPPAGPCSPRAAEPRLWTATLHHDTQPADEGVKRTTAVCPK